MNSPFFLKDFCLQPQVTVSPPLPGISYVLGPSSPLTPSFDPKRRMPMPSTPFSEPMMRGMSHSAGERQTFAHPTGHPTRRSTGHTAPSVHLDDGSHAYTPTPVPNLPPSLPTASCCCTEPPTTTTTTTMAPMPATPPPPPQPEPQSSQPPAKRKRWSDDDMLRAIELAKTKQMSARGAAALCNVPCSTLWDRLSGRVVHGCDNRKKRKQNVP